MNFGMVLDGTKIHQLYDVNLEQGVFYHKRPQWYGKRAGYSTKVGYRVLCIGYKDYFEHNLVWFLKTGEWLPTKTHEIDHINRIKSDNRPINLRKATRSQNNANMDAHKNSKTGLRGVWFNEQKKKYCAQVTVQKRRYSLGYFVNAQEAAEAASEFRKKQFGDFAG